MWDNLPYEVQKLLQTNDDNYNNNHCNNYNY
jgi:hypothetical protein